MRRIRASLLSLAVAVGLSCALVVVLQGRSSAQPALPAASAGPTAAPAASRGIANLRLNELMADNKTTLIDPDEPTQTPDWIEVYNPGPDAVSLKNVSFSDTADNPTKTIITADLTIPAGGFLVLFADGSPKQGPRHLNFKLGNSGEFVGMYDATNPAAAREIDKVDFPALLTDQSYGRLPDGSGAWNILAAPSPGQSNQVNPPHVDDLSQPPYPAPVSAAVAVSATVTGVNLPLTTTLVYSTGGSASSIVMSGTGGLVEASIPGQPEGTLVTYYVRVTDSTGQSTRFPLEGRDYRYLTGYIAPNVLMNEIVVDNGSQTVDPIDRLETPDWIELINLSGAPITLKGVSVSNDKANPTMYRIPDGRVIPAGGFLVLLADDDPSQTAIDHAFVHLNFTIKKSGDYVGLYGGEGSVRIDHYEFNDPPLFGVFARLPDGAGAWTTEACMSFNQTNIPCDNMVHMPMVERAGP